ncbi:hypothetical protein Esti_005848 [Eimeria stiedai]
MSSDAVCAVGGLVLGGCEAAAKALNSSVSPQETELQTPLEHLEAGKGPWKQERQACDAEPSEETRAEARHWDLWKLAAPVPALKSASQAEDEEDHEPSGDSSLKGATAATAGADLSAASAAAVQVSTLCSREASAMEDAAPTRCPTEDTLHESAVSAALLSLTGKQDRQAEAPLQKKAAATAASLPEESSSGALAAAAAAAAAGSSSPFPPLYALCELAADLHRVLKDVQGVQRQILQAQKSIAWVIGEPGSEALAVTSQQQEQQQQQQEAHAKAAAVEAAFRLAAPPSVTQQQQDVCNAASAAAAVAAAAASPTEGDASSLRSLVDLLGKQQQLDELDSATAAAVRNTKLMKPLPLDDAAQWPLENTSAAAAFIADAASYAAKREAFRSSCCSLEQEQLESEGGSHLQQQRMQSEASLSACGPQRKRFKGTSGVVDFAPMPGVRFAKDRNSWVAFWCENGKQNYKSFSNKKFGPEMARLMAIAARQSFDDRSNNKAAAAAGGSFLRSYAQRSPDQNEGCSSPAGMLSNAAAAAGSSLHGLSNAASTSSSTSTRTPSGGNSEGGEEHQQLSRAEMQQLAASLGNPKGVCYAPSNNTWMAYGSMGSGARMCRSFPVSKFGFYGARRLAIKAVSQYQQKQQQQTTQEGPLAAGRSSGACDPSSSCVPSVGSHAQSLASLKASFDYTSALQLVASRAGDMTSPDSYLRRRRMDSSRQLLHAATGKASGELDLGALQQAAEHVVPAGVGTSAYPSEAVARGAPEECGAPPAGLTCGAKAEAGSDPLMGSDLSMASALLLPLVASGRLMRFSEDESVVRSATDLSGLNVAREEAL